MKEEFKNCYLRTLNLDNLPADSKQAFFIEVQKLFKEDAVFADYVIETFSKLKHDIEENNFIFTNIDNKKYLTINNNINVYLDNKTIKLSFEKEHFSFIKEIGVEDYEAKVFKKKSNLPLMKAINLHLNENNDIDYTVIRKIAEVFFILNNKQDFIDLLDLIPLKTEITYSEMLKRLTGVSGILLLQDLDISPNLSELKNLIESKNKNKTTNI